MKYWGPAFGLFVFAVPLFAHAQVVINEVMYDPSGSNTGRQWIELYNQGASDVTMIGGTVKNSWRVSDGSNHTLTDPAGGVGRGSLTIPAGGYLVVSSDPTTFLGEYGSGSYSVVKSSISLKSTGGTISLVDGSGTTIDSFTYASSMGGAGDGTSLQKTADGSWISALATPGAANASTAYTPPANTDSTTTQQTDTTAQNSQTQTAQTQTAPTSSYVTPPTPDLYANAGADRTVIAGADVEFDASAYDKNQQTLDATTVRFSWNFGDGTTAEGTAVLHHFTYPGRYDVVLTIAQNKEAVADDVIVTVEPAALGFTLLQDGGLSIENRAGHDLDLSNWIVKQDSGLLSAQFMLPDHSKILAGSSMNISAQTLQFHASSSTILEYPNGTGAFAIGQATETHSPVQPVQDVQNVAPAAPVVRAAPSPSSKSVHTIAAPEISPPDDSVDATQTPASMTIGESAAVASAPASKYLWWLGVLALAGAAAFAIAAAAHFKKGEWDIIEDTSE